MAKLANARTIARLERLLHSGNPSPGRRRWKIDDVECMAERHRCTTQDYVFSIEIVHIRLSTRAWLEWHLMIVSERWWDHADEVIRDVRWLKLISGAATHVLDWLRRCEAARDPIGHRQPTEGQAKRAAAAPRCRWAAAFSSEAICAFRHGRRGQPRQLNASRQYFLIGGSE